MNGLLRHLVVLFSLLILPGQDAYSRIPASSFSPQSEKHCLIKDQSPAPVITSDIEDDSENDLKSIDHSVLINFSYIETSIIEKKFLFLISASPIIEIKRNILHAVFRI
jgi:hypothetical protein